VDDIGYDAVDVGPLSVSRPFQPGGMLYRPVSAEDIALYVVSD
jgi:predicted dinucleotide-binding enzyme